MGRRERVRLIRIECVCIDVVMDGIDGISGKLKLIILEVQLSTVGSIVNREGYDWTFDLSGQWVRQNHHETFVSVSIVVSWKHLCRPNWDIFWCFLFASVFYFQIEISDTFVWNFRIENRFVWLMASLMVVGGEGVDTHILSYAISWASATWNWNQKQNALADWTSDWA